MDRRRRWIADHGSDKGEIIHRRERPHGSATP
jgi:hypothetical protein